MKIRENKQNQAIVPSEAQSPRCQPHHDGDRDKADEGQGVAESLSQASATLEVGNTSSIGKVLAAQA